MHVASTNVACPGLLWKPLPLDATVGRLLAPNRSGGRQGDNQQNDDAKYTYFAGLAILMAIAAAVQYQAHID